MLLPHVRQDELSESRGAEHVDFELAAGFFHRYVFDGAVGAVAGVVDQDVDAALLGEDPVDPGPHRLLVGDVHCQRADTGLGEVSHALDPPGRGVDGVAGLAQLLRGGLADAG